MGLVGWKIHLSRNKRPDNLKASKLTCLTSATVFLRSKNSFIYNSKSWPGSSVGRAED